MAREIIVLDFPEQGTEAAPTSVQHFRDMDSALAAANKISGVRYAICDAMAGIIKRGEPATSPLAPAPAKKKVAVKKA